MPTPMIRCNNNIYYNFICQSCEYPCTSGKNIDLTIGNFDCVLLLCDECFISLKKEVIKL